jgi:hypothetical protein
VPVAFQGIPAGALVRPISYEVKYLQDSLFLGGSSGFWYRAEGDQTPIGMSGNIALRKPDSRETSSSQFVELEIAPIRDGGWISVAREQDVRVSVSTSDYVAPVMKNPTPWRDARK